MPSSVLVIDDSDKVREQIIRTVMDSALFGSYREARDGLEGFKSMVNSKPDLVICDLEMPRVDGFKFLQMVHTREELQDIPIIILTGSSDQQSKIKGLDQGACDYVTKPFDAAELVARVKVHLKIKKLQDDLNRAIEHFKGLSLTDPLTSLYNRRHVTEILDKEFERAERKREVLSLVIFDITGTRMETPYWWLSPRKHEKDCVPTMSQHAMAERNSCLCSQEHPWPEEWWLPSA